jgi:hypothetical protein
MKEKRHIIEYAKTVIAKEESLPMLKVAREK